MLVFQSPWPGLAAASFLISNLVGCANGAPSGSANAPPTQGSASDPDAAIECAIDANCDDGELCNGAETCVGGICTAGSPLANGTACDDASLCTTGDSCAAGSCVGTPLDCSASDGVCLIGTCDESNGTCTARLAPDGSLCDDGASCTTEDRCTAGVCDGAAVDCSALDTMCSVGICDPHNGSCATDPLMDGTPCDDGNELTEMDVCTAGLCAGTAHSEVFTFTGAAALYTVPEGVTRLRIDATGATGGDACDDITCTLTVEGGPGGHVDAIVDVRPGEVLTIAVGEQPAMAGFGTDGCGAGGGGATFVVRGAALSSTPLESILVVAAGGGGAGGYRDFGGGPARMIAGDASGGLGARTEGGGGGGLASDGGSAGAHYGQGGGSLSSGARGGAGATSEDCTTNAGGFGGGGGGGNDGGGGGGGYSGGSASTDMTSEGGTNFAVSHEATLGLRIDRGHGSASLTPVL